MTPSKRLHGLMKGQRLLPFTAGERLCQKGVGTKSRFLLKGAFIDPEIEPTTFVWTELQVSLSSPSCFYLQLENVGVCFGLTSNIHLSAVSASLLDPDLRFCSWRRRRTVVWQG